MSTDDDKLKDLFEQLKTEEPSLGFNDRLMLKISGLVEKKAKRRKVSTRVLAGLGFLCGLAGLLGLTWFLFSYYGVQVNTPQLSWSSLELNAPKVEFPSMMVMLAVAVMLLLGADMLIRKHGFVKKQKK